MRLATSPCESVSLKMLGEGVFSRVPPQFTSTSALVRAIVDAAAVNHGHGIRRFLRQLVKARAADEARLKRRISRLVERFTEQARVDPNDGSAVRVAEAFGLVYAAGVLAQRFRVLPADWKCGPAVLRCYREYRVAPVAPTRFIDMLERLASSDAVVHIAKGDPVKSERVAAAEVIIKQKKGSREIMVVSEAIEKWLPGWRSLRRRSDVKALLQNEKGRQTVKRKLHKQLPARRVYSFEISASPGV